MKDQIAKIASGLFARLEWTGTKFNSDLTDNSIKRCNALLASVELRRSFTDLPSFASAIKAANIGGAPTLDEYAGLVASGGTNHAEMAKVAESTAVAKEVAEMASLGRDSWAPSGFNPNGAFGGGRTYLLIDPAHRTLTASVRADALRPWTDRSNVKSLLISIVCRLGFSFERADEIISPLFKCTDRDVRNHR